MNVYIDGIFDLFHYGHVESFRKCKELYPTVTLLVGVISDKQANSYKRTPIYSEQNRYCLVKNCKFVDIIIEDAPLQITKEFMEIHKIDMVVHSFKNKEDEDNQSEFFAYPKSIHKFRTIDYCNEISTTEIINKIQQIKESN